MNAHTEAHTDTPSRRCHSPCFLALTRAPRAGVLVQVREALRFVDTDGSGTINREEIKEMLYRFNILAPPGEAAAGPNGAPRVTEDVLDTFVECCQGLSLHQGDGDTRVECDEFSEVIMAKDIMAFDWEGNAEWVEPRVGTLQVPRFQSPQTSNLPPPPTPHPMLR